MEKAFDYIGRKVLVFLDEAGKIALLAWQILVQVFKKPSESKSILQQMVIIGNKSFTVVTITSLSTGMILALQTGTAFERKISGAANMLGGVVSLALTRELAPVLIGLVMAGKIGSAIAAEIGTMAVTEQVDALKTMATNPVKYLAVPRFLAAIVMLPVLTIYADILGTFGGYIISANTFDGTFAGYMDSMISYILASDIYKGLFKTMFFGAIIAVVGCQRGFETEGGAEGVGRATTSSVVISSMLILVTDYILSAFLW